MCLLCVKIDWFIVQGEYLSQVITRIKGIQTEVTRKEDDGVIDIDKEEDQKITCIREWFKIEFTKRLFRDQKNQPLNAYLQDDTTIQ